MSSLHLTIVDERVEILVNGVLLTAFADVVDWTETDDFDEISYVTMGKSGTELSQDFRGHSGTVTVKDASPVVEETRQAIITARTGRTPVSITIVRTVFYKSGDVNTYTYMSCIVVPTRTVTQGQATEMSLQWKTGKPRKES